MEEEKEVKKQREEHAKHRERMRESYLKSGGKNLHEHQLLEMVLYYALPRKDTNALAHRLIRAYGSAQKVYKADVFDLEKQKGVGRNTAVLLSLCGELIRRYGQGEVNTNKQKLSTPESAVQYCRSLYDNTLNEQTYVISLDGSKNVLHADLISTGTPKETTIYPRLVIEKAIRHGASSVIITHNHPSGNVQPSLKDISTTKEIFEILDKIGIELFDHIIIGDNKAYSMARGNEDAIFSTPSPFHLVAAQKEE